MIRKRDTLFDDVELQLIYHENTFSLGDTYLTFLSQCVQYLFVQHTEKKAQCDTECFVSVSSLNVVFGLQTLFIRSLIDGVENYLPSYLSS